MNENYRIGTTSYIIPDNILPNVEFLAGKVKDVELVLFEVDDGPNNLPDMETLNRMNEIAAQQDLTYTVHLPLDLEFGFNEDSYHISLEKAKKVIQLTKNLNPYAFVVHLNGRELLENGYDQQSHQIWVQNSLRALDLVSVWAGSPQKICVENLEKYPLEFWEPVFEKSEVSRCIDIGHLLLDNHDPIPYLNQNLSRAKVLHLHGIKERDHRSIIHIDQTVLKNVFQTIKENHYQDILTLEIFDFDDFNTSMDLLKSLSLL